MAADPATVDGALSTVNAIALVGALGVGAQWLAWRLKLPAIVLMLLAGVLVGPVLGLFDPARDIGPITAPLISLAVAVILFEGGLTLTRSSLADAEPGVRRLVFVGAPLGWLTSVLALHYGAGLGWESAAVFGGIMIVTGPTVIAPLLRHARLSKRPAALLQWEAILNDPIGALAAVLAFAVVSVLHTTTTATEAAMDLALGIGVATALGLAAGYGTARAFCAGSVPEYMKVPVLFATLIAIFALSDSVLHESGLLAVTIMGVVIANANLPSYTELRRFKEHVTVLLVSGVFILLAAGLDFAALRALDWRAAVFVALVVLVARPVSVLLALMGTDLPSRERWLVALTGPRGVVLVAVAGLFGERLSAMGVADAALIGPLAFVLVAATVALHGFTLKPLARALRLVGAERPGVLLVGGSRFTTALAEALNRAEVPVTLADPNYGHLAEARKAGLGTFAGDILSEAAEHRLDFVRYDVAIAATDNDAYNTLVATQMGHEIGRDNSYQVTRARNHSPRHQLPATLGGKAFGQGEGYDGWERLMRQGWRVAITGLSAEYGQDDWQADNPEGRILGLIDTAGHLTLLNGEDAPEAGTDTRLLTLVPPEEGRGDARDAR